MDDFIINKALKLRFPSRNYDSSEFLSERHQFHASQPGVSIDIYRSRILHKLGRIVSGRKIVYLDQKYWIKLRDVQLGRTHEKAYTDLLTLLKTHTASGIFICPLSTWVFEELLKQNDRATRLATAQLIDDLSLGVSYIPQPEMVRQEVVHFIRKFVPAFKSDTSWPIRECIWTRLVSVFGDRIPTWPETIPAEHQLVIQKTIEDINFLIPLTEIISSFDNTEANTIEPLYDVSEINARKKTVRSTHKNFKSLFLAELIHSHKEHEKDFFEVVSYLYELKTGHQESPPIQSIPDDLRLRMEDLIYTAFKEDKITNELPSYHIPACLYSYATWNTNRILKENDVYDFLHAQLGIPYSDFFLTDGGLKSDLCSELLRLDKIYQTVVISKPEIAIEKLRKIVMESESQSPDKPTLHEELFR